MLYSLLFKKLSQDYSWLNVFGYQTFRAMMAFLFTFVLVLVLEPIFIRWLTNIGVKGQPIRDDGPEMHAVKQGTPTMGGAVIIFSIVLSGLLFCDLSNIHVLLSLGVLFAFSLVGFFDDWSKVSKQNTGGITERQKLVSQATIAILASSYLYFSDFPNTLTIPFLKNFTINMGIFFIVFSAIVIIGTSNAVNLTDGLDGLAIGPIMTVAFTYGIFCYAAGHSKIADYLNITYIPYLGEISIILAAVLAGGLGFLWYNTFPAQVFMGDTGALAFGGLLGIVAVLAKQELVLVIAGGIFVVETLSVIIQRYYYKLRKKRVFKMAPIHHHFELLGWAEPKIIVRFWIISIVLALISLSTLKLR